MLHKTSENVRRKTFVRYVVSEKCSKSSIKHHNQVNNAYEVLNDANNRRVRIRIASCSVSKLPLQLYDQYGVWPPPQHMPNAPRRRSHHSHMDSSPGPSHHTHRFPFSDPFFTNRSPPPGNYFSDFSDPFDLFDSVFGASPRRNSSPSEWNESPLERHRRLHEDLMRSFERDMFHPTSFATFGGVPHFFPHHDRFMALPFPSSQFGGSLVGDNYDPSPSQEFSSITINGVTETYHKRTDADVGSIKHSLPFLKATSQGNEYIQRTLPDGRKTYTVNGVEQKDKCLPPASGNRDGHPPAENYVEYPQPAPSYSHSHHYSGGFGMFPPCKPGLEFDLLPQVPPGFHSPPQPKRWCPFPST